MTSDADKSPGFFRRRPLRRALKNWLKRHRHPFNFWIHLVGIPLAVAGVVLFFALPWSQWYWGVAAFVGGYILQYIGHCVEGNDLGEWAGIKRLLGLPYVGVAPRWSAESEARSAEGGARSAEREE
ncbi:MAG: DUF962 domain-containing protein [Gemmataceae bacterium]|nr:DUF962 domain-containing protein [Gemmataceae bacterium]MCI0741199.1 DUF962 domain-containing protein [Gemmataceae bacterium]